MPMKCKNCHKDIIKVRNYCPYCSFPQRYLPFLPTFMTKRTVVWLALFLAFFVMALFSYRLWPVYANKRMASKINTLESENASLKNEVNRLNEEKATLEARNAELQSKKVADDNVVPPKQETPPDTVSVADKIDCKTVKTITNSIGMEFVLIPHGEFMMGSPESESGRYDDENQHKVTLTKDFYMQTTEVTQGQWKAIMGDNPSSFKDCGDDCPVENVSWDDAQAFIEKLNKKERKNYRLPTEAEWEYAARARSQAAYSFGDDAGQLSEYAWYSANSGSGTHKVGDKKPNDWCLYDMHGNVWEWVSDWYGAYPASDVVDPTGTEDSSVKRVLRGGSWRSSAQDCRCANRSRFAPSYRFVNGGFRLALSLGQ
jgi:formylglycine-generating enzyme required for sulfatase activity